MLAHDLPRLDPHLGQTPCNPPSVTLARHLQLRRLGSSCFATSEPWRSSAFRAAAGRIPPQAMSGAQLGKRARTRAPLAPGSQLRVVERMGLEVTRLAQVQAARAEARP